jgi:tRNA nucleotidyltransferase/poly(A) polymerase
MQVRQRLDLVHRHSDYPLAHSVIETLAATGAQTLFAGGGVRDALLGIAPKDLDLATSAAPSVVERAFARTVDIGKDFGTIVVVDGKRQIEVTTFRREDVYLDGRRPSAVTFTDAREDAARRDFTVNAIFYDPRTETVIDFESGRADLAAKILRTVGDPRRRFAEDRLRMLRAVRFVAQLGFELEPATAAAIRAEAAALGTVAPERVLAEMKRLLTAPGRAAGLRAARATGVLEVVWPECDQTFVDAEFLGWENAFAALSWSAGPEVAAARASAWRAPNEAKRRITEQMRAARVLTDPGSSRPARLRAWGSAYGPDVRALARVLVSPEAFEIEREAFARIATPEGELPAAWLNGADLARLGVEPGARMGELLRRLYDAQLDGRISGRDEAEDRARLWLNE